MNKRAFTLFTALVSFILIVLATILVEAMIKTERTSTDTISEIQEQAEMQTVADLARADAIQVFNFGMRRRIELFFTNPEYDGYLLTPKEVGGTLQTDPQQIVQDFQVTFFGNADESTNFASALSGELTTLLRSERTYKGYTVTLESNQQNLQEGLKQIQKNSTLNGKKFFEVVDCKAFDPKNLPFSMTDDDCKNGSFYINLDISTLSDADYEKLPQIRVESSASGRIIKEPILPRGTFRLYVPLRYFQAMAKAKKMAYEPQGLFSQKGKYDDAKLGLCDASACIPRSNAFQSTSLEDSQHLCAQDPRATLENQTKTLQTCNPSDICDGGSYDSFEASKQSRALEFVLEKELCDQAKLETFTQNGLEILPGINFGCENVKKIVVSAAAYDFKPINTVGLNKKDYTVRCSEASQIKLLMEFKENDSHYLVDPNNPSNSHTFRVAIADTRYQPAPITTQMCTSELHGEEIGTATGTCTIGTSGA